MPNPDAILADHDYGLTRAHLDEVKDVLLHRERLVRLENFALQKQAAAVAGERFIRKFGSAGTGQVVLSIMPYLYHKLGRFYGYDCWNDADFLKHVWKHYPETRVRSRSVNPTVTVLADVAPANKRFTKTYAEPLKVQSSRFDVQRFPHAAKTLNPEPRTSNLEPPEAACAA